MRVLVDAHMVGHRETGNETYVRGLLSGLSSFDGVTVGAAIDPAITNLPPFPASVTVLPLPSSSSLRRLTGGFADLCRTWRADIAHASYIAPYRLPCPVAVSLHDVSFRRFPEFFSARDRLLFSTLLPHSMSRAAAILTLSSHARDEISHFYPAHRKKVFVVPAAPNDFARLLHPDAVSAVLAKHDVRPPFLLAVGSLQPRKNLQRLVEAFADVAETRSIRLVIVGPSGFQSSRVHDTIAERGLTTSVRWLGYVPDVELAALYNAAVALVYPSVYEGFGLPVVEAMACGCPVIAANTSAIPEVAGDAAILVDPLRVPDISAAIRRVLADDTLARTMKARGPAQAAKFSWRRSAEAALGAYRAALS